MGIIWLVLIAICFCVGICLLVGFWVFIFDVPKILKRIADALESIHDDNVRRSL